MNVRIFRGQERVDAIGADDRGLNYGDGLFETCRVHAGQPVWWDAHWRRLERSARILALPLPEQAFVLAQALALLDGAASGVLKLLLSRGAGGRGYAPPPAPTPTLVLARHALPPATGPLTLRWCRTPLAIQPALAGIKHLNRLEQVLARAEWSDPDVHEGLMCDTDGRVVCATAGNVFALVDGRWLTPSVARCGVAGITREWLLARHPAMAEAELRPADLERAQAVFLCNAVRGIQPVARLGSRTFAGSDEVARLRADLARVEPAFAEPA